MADFRTRDPEQMHFQALKQRTKYFKEEPKGVGTMCRAVEDLVKKELSRTVENIVKNELNEAFLQLVQNMSKQKLSLVQMCPAVHFTEYFFSFLAFCDILHLEKVFGGAL